jgi:hypothetical protein
MPVLREIVVVGSVVLLLFYRERRVGDKTTARTS